jgi:hypothetical protein
MKFLRRKAMQVSWIQKVLPMPKGSAVRLTNAKAMTLKIQEGLVWITEEGVEEDHFLINGEHYAVQGEGLVIISAESDARLDFGSDEQSTYVRSVVDSVLKMTGHAKTQSSW